MDSPRVPRPWALLVLLVLPLFLRLWPIGHGLPENHVPDTHLVRSALGMARDKDLVPEVGRYSTYPNLLPYLLLPVYAGEFAVGKLTGQWSSGAEFGERLMVEPQRAHLPARVLFALLASLAPWIAWRAGRVMGLGVGALAAAYLVATSLLHVQFSVQERPWAPMVTFLAAGVWASALYARDGRRRWLALSGVATGLAFATHQAGLPMLLLPGLAWLFAGPGWRGEALRARVVDGVVCVALFALVALLLGHPYYLVHGAVDRSAVAAGDALPEQGISVGGQGFVFELRGASFRRLSRALVGYDPVLLVLGVAGVLAALRRREARAAAAFALFWAAVFLTNQGDHVRYLLPLAVLLVWPAGIAVERLWRSPAVRPALIALAVVPLVQALRLGWVLRQEDTRAVMEVALARDFPAAAIAVDAYGPDLPLDRASLERLAGWRELGARERHRLEEVRAHDGGFDAVPLEAIVDYDVRAGTCAIEQEERATLGDDLNAALRELGCTHVLVADRSPGDGRPPLLLDPEPRPGKMPALRVDDAPLLVVSPGEVDDASLPAELTFPLTQLWRTRRPGPELALYRLAR